MTHLFRSTQGKCPFSNRLPFFGRSQADTNAYNGTIPDKVGQWRLQYFREQLYSITYRVFLKAKEDLKGLGADLCKDMGLSDGDSDDENNEPMTEWPEFFEV